MATNACTIDRARFTFDLMPEIGQFTFTGSGTGDGTISLWDPPAVIGNPFEHWCVGLEYGDELADYLLETDDVVALGAITRAILGRGRIGVVELGFFVALSRALRP